MNSPGWQVPNMLLEISGETTPERMKGWSQSKNNKEKLREYILSANKDIDKVNIFSKFRFYNYKITTKEELDKIYNNCINYILDYIENKLSQ